MNDDLDEYMPDVRKVFDESQPELVKERRRKAVERLVDEGLIDRRTPPTPAPPEDRPVTKRAAPVEAAKRSWLQSWKAAIGLLLLGATMPVLVVVAGRAKETKEKAAASATAASATAVAVPDTAAAVMGTAPPSATAIPSATAALFDAGTAPAPARTSTPRPMPRTPTMSPPVADDILP